MNNRGCFSAGPWPTALATTANLLHCDSDAPPANALTMDGLTLGRFWLGEAGEQSMAVDLQFTSAQSFAFAMALGVRRPDGTFPVIRVYDGSWSDSHPEGPLATLRDAPPCNLMFDHTSNGSVTSSVWGVKVDVSSIGGTEQLCVPFFALGTMDGYFAYYLLGGSKQVQRTMTKRIPQIYGGQFTRIQPTAFGIAAKFHGGIMDPELIALLTSAAAVGLHAPMLLIRNEDRAGNSYGENPPFNTVVGGLDALPEPSTDGGSVLTEFELTVIESVA